MEIKNEVQEKIISEREEKVGEDEFLSILRSVAPGTNFRTALEGSLKAGKGALLVVTNDMINSVIDGGFKINCKFTPQKLIELTKMDGAIILSKDLKKIVHANVLLTPESRIRSEETGTRHKAAERTAKQIGTLVVAISERKHEINLFYKNLKYPLISTDELLRKANEHVQILEKQKEMFEKNVEKLNKMELRNQFNLKQASSVIQKGRLIQKISSDLKRYLVELGRENTLLKIRLKEITSGVEKETDLVIKDYTSLDLKKSKNILESLSYEEILDSDNVIKVLARESYSMNSPIKGWRVLSRTSLSDAEIAQLVKASGNVGKAVHSNFSFYKEIFGEDKASILKEDLERMKIDS